MSRRTTDYLVWGSHHTHHLTHTAMLRFWGIRKSKSFICRAKIMIFFDLFLRPCETPQKISFSVIDQMSKVCEFSVAVLSQNWKIVRCRTWGYPPLPLTPAVVASNKKSFSGSGKLDKAQKYRLSKSCTCRFLKVTRKHPNKSTCKWLLNSPQHNLSRENRRVSCTRRFVSSPVH